MMANAPSAPTARLGMAENDDVEDVMLPYSDLRLEPPLFVELDDEAGIAEPTKSDDASAKFHAVFAKSQARFVPDDHRLAGESPELIKPYAFHLFALDTADLGTFK